MINLVQYRFLIAIGLVLSFNSCMMGMHGSESKIEKIILPNQTSNRSDKIDVILEKMIDNLSSKNLGIQTITVWDIRSKSAIIDSERIRQHIIMKLVNDTRFQVVTRTRLQELLEEQNLALSGVLDVKEAMAIGTLIGIEGFIDGYLSEEQNKIEIHLKLIDANKGVVVWAFSQDESI